ncbi:MAG TPA: hypothetical protein VFF33_04995 [Ignavibacteriaceae bacterium]|nr:hypothetical protein [Ignavibacteriaceae bacterium]
MSEHKSTKKILEKKAQEGESLKEAVESEEQPTYQEEITKEVNEEGKEVLVFKDPLYSREKRSVVTYTIFKGKWEFEDIDNIDDNPESSAIKFMPRTETSHVTIVFKSIKDRLEFMDSIYSDNELKQSGTGMSLEKFANSKIMKTTGGIVGGAIASYGLYKMFFGKGKEKK